MNIPITAKDSCTVTLCCAVLCFVCSSFKWHSKMQINNLHLQMFAFLWINQRFLFLFLIFFRFEKSKWNWKCKYSSTRFNLCIFLCFESRESTKRQRKRKRKIKGKKMCFYVSMFFFDLLLPFSFHVYSFNLYTRYQQCYVFFSCDSFA